MGRNKYSKKPQSKKNYNSSSSSSSSSNDSSDSSQSDSSSESDVSINYGTNKRNKYKKQNNKITKDIEDDYNLYDNRKSRTKIQSQHQIKNRFTPQKSRKSIVGKSFRSIEPAEFQNNPYQVPTNTVRLNGGNKLIQIAELQKPQIENRSRAKSDVFNYLNQNKMQVEDINQAVEDHNLNNYDLSTDMKKNLQRRQSHRIMHQSYHSIQSNNGSTKGNQIIISPQYDSSHGFNFKQQAMHHTSNFARIIPINNSLDHSKNDPKSISINNSINVNQQENQIKENQQDMLKLDLKNKELNRLQNQQRHALTTVGNALKRKQSIENIEFFNRQQEKQLQEKKKSDLSYNNCIQKTKKLWSFLVKKIQYNHFLTEFVYKIVNMFGLKSIFHFKFLTTCINYYLFGTILFIFPIVKQIIQYSDQISSQGVQIFYLYQLQDSLGLIVYFNFLIIFLAAILILMSYYRYLHYQKNSVMFEVQKTKGLKYFTMIFCEYNWKIPGEKPRLWFQLSLTNKVFSSFEDEDQVYRRQIYVNQIQQLLKDMLFYILYISTMLASGYFMLILCNNKLFNKQVIPNSLFLNECLFSIVVIALVEVVSFLLAILMSVLRHFENSCLQLKSQYSIEFIYQAVVYSIYIFIRCTASFTREEFIVNIVDYNYQNDGYVCPQQSTAHSLFSLYLVHYVFILYLKQYFKLLLNLIQKNDDHVKSGLKCAMDNKNRRQFKVVEDTIPLIISNMIIFMNTPFNFILFPIALILNLILLLHNYFIIKKWKLPEYLTITSIDIHGILVKMFLLTVFFMFLHFFFISLADQPLHYFADNLSRVCGPFTQNNTNILSYTFQYFYNSYFFQESLDIVFWQPLLVCIIVFFILKTIADNRQYKKWVKILQYRSKDINSVKKHYKKKVSKLQKQLENAAKNIKQIQKESAIPQMIKPNQQQKPLEEHNISANIQVNDHQKSVHEQLRTEESQFQQHTQNYFLRPRKRSSFGNEHSEIQNFNTKPDSEFGI
ncbi:transmembrane protein, putative (macronuclear) [Tetrahymena thermophila SB210]|uniref:Transmembrane protein, putative n=1 Tax=Tetrahymena thermophila (strain SB210) TaxID=312017 RepID=I7MJM0_TETTS|nr:transmembrane protein, putative [Tetrahymena thermophila SB210]EAS06766.2 transmembrane protein, putative [Tetrahymena thermophila SB210]|eukprot:XP_001027008.2 transmembrane protein, putative [Tetrahymena thermophila SB210]